MFLRVTDNKSEMEYVDFNPTLLLNRVGFLACVGCL